MLLRRFLSWEKSIPPGMDVERPAARRESLSARSDNLLIGKLTIIVSGKNWNPG
ncbi:MAG: hypothetical protein ACOY90_17195 [Candidatus Zhuqueibacterota bacterium]